MALQATSVCESIRMSMSIPNTMPKIRSDPPWIMGSGEDRQAEKARGCMTDPTEAILAYLRQIGAGLDPDFLREAVRVMSTLLMEMEVKQQIGADRYERTENRTTYAPRTGELTGRPML